MIKYKFIYNGFRRMAFFALLSILCLKGLAEQPDSLLTYLGLAAKNNPVVLQKFYEYQAALEKIPQAGSLSDPELNVGVFLSPMELIGGKQVADIQLMQMFPWFGILRNAKDEMSLMAAAKFESFRETKLQVFFDVQRTWYELYRYRQNISISQKNLDILKTLERIALVRYKTTPTGGAGPSTSSTMSGSVSSSGSSSANNMTGMGTKAVNPQPATQQQPMQTGTMSSAGSTGLADLYLIQIEIGNLENNISLLKTRYNTIMARFNTYLNRPLNHSVWLPDTMEKEKAEATLLAFSDSSFSENPMITMLQYEQQSMEARKKMVKKMGYPMVGLGLNYSMINKSDMTASGMNGDDMIMPMIKITLPVYRKKYKAMVREADLNKTAAAQSITAAVNDVQVEYFEVVEAYQDAERRLSLFRSQSQLAGKSLDIMVRSYSASTSGASLSDILTLRQQTLDYDFKLIEALVDYNTAVAQLKKLLGSQLIEKK